MSLIKRLRCFFLLDVILNIAVIIYSWHLCCWRRRGLTLLSFWRECADPDLPKCIYVRINYSWSSFTYSRSDYKGFYESLQIAFPNNVLVNQFRGWSLQSARHSTEERWRGQQSSLAFKATWTTKRLDENRADFDRVKKVFFTLPLRNFNQSMLYNFH